MQAVPAARVGVRELNKAAAPFDGYGCFVLYGLLYVETERAAKQLLGVGTNWNASFCGGASQGIDGVRAQGEVDGGLTVILGDSAFLTLYGIFF